MRYAIRGLEIRSENAAKPASSAGRWMLNWIRQLPVDAHALDIGCGKLRYTVPLSRRTTSVTAVDSAIQLDRRQRLFGKLASVRAYAAETLSNVKVYELEDRTWHRKRYEIIVCSNVLSAIPCRKTRTRLVRTARTCLSARGRLLLTTQFRNSHFKRWKTARNAARFLDGYLVRGKRGTSFYGLLDAAALAQLCRRCGLRILQTGHAGELAYVLASR
jgi:2-polyprenyl-3-methyl-5-hydroxy-6-metoxy-1,4-benzoquinol methylase